ncbi:hypothetical protein [Chryseosolibacter indicus]|uniref:Uncharacterized protein n=1 Tax=Chryseosolibacter indicus TaxID=2782351 RepID=A0ABS5VQX0_9BACT|nr:hypothetical protein [Chryseosolibacter indicus]MBT1703746.1 hypothetical protein [Chryseosolibacter indicus]
MARIKVNSLVNGLSGSIGGLTFRTRNKTTIVSGKLKAPRKQSAAQRANRNKFQDASLHVKTALLDPQLKTHYMQLAGELGLTNAYTAAMSEYLRNGKLLNLDSKKRIRKKGRKNSKATNFKIALLYGNGNTVESELPFNKEIQLLFYKVFKNSNGKKPMRIRLSQGDSVIYLSKD